MSWDLDRLLAPRTASEFFAGQWDRGCWHLPGEADKFAGLFDWQELNRILGHTRLSPKQLQLIKEGNRAAPTELFAGPAARFAGADRRLVDQGELLTQLRAGRSLLLADVQDLSAEVAALGRCVGQALGEEVWFTLIASCGEAHAFATHWDDQDTFILQLAGKKRWRLYGRTDALDETLDTGRQRAPQTVTQEVVLEPGGLLYLPRGHWHDADTLGEPALQLMLWVPKRTGFDVVSDAIAGLRRDPRLLETLSRFTAPGEQRARAAEIRRALVERLDDDSIERLFRGITDRSQVAPKPDLPWSISREASAPMLHTEVHVRAPAPLRVAAQADDVRISAGARTFTFPVEALPIAQLLAQKGAATVGELVAATDGAFEEGEVRSFVGELLASGILARG